LGDIVAVAGILVAISGIVVSVGTALPQAVNMNETAKMIYRVGKLLAIFHLLNLNAGL
jgi:hypothetical protein